MNLPRRSQPSLEGIALVEVLVALALLTVMVVSSTQALVQTNRRSAGQRTMTAARAVVQRNVDTALAVAWNSTVEPPILALTPTNGTPYDDDAAPGNNADGVVQIAVMEDGITTTVPGTLWRVVAAVANAEGAQIRRVTFRLDYKYLSRPYSVQMATIRAIDD